MAGIHGGAVLLVPVQPKPLAYNGEGLGPAAIVLLET